MKALQYQSPGNPTIIETPEPIPGPGEVKVKIDAVATCPHWDIHLMRGEQMLPGIPLDYPYPAGQPGHEATGVVVEIGDGVTSLKPGNRVAAWRDPGQDRPGSYAQYNIFLEDNLLAIPESLPVEGIASLELAMCVQVSFDKLVLNDLIRHKRVAISGLGPAGLVAAQMARAYGAESVVGIEPDEGRRDILNSLGFSETYAPDNPEMSNLTRRSDNCFDTSVDCTGLKPSIEYLMDRTNSAVTIFGVLREELVFGPKHWFGLSLIGYDSHNREAARRALYLIESGNLDLAPLITTSLPISAYLQGIEMLENKEAVKILYLPWEE